MKKTFAAFIMIPVEIRYIFSIIIACVVILAHSVFFGCATTIDEDRLQTELQRDVLLIDNITNQFKSKSSQKKAKNDNVMLEKPASEKTEVKNAQKVITPVTSVKPSTPVAKLASVVVPAQVAQTQEASMPCYLHSPPNGISRGDIIEIHNMTQHPLGLRVNGLPLVIVGATPPSYMLMPAGIKITPNLLPQDYRCYFIPYNFSRMNVEASMYRINPYNGTMQVIARGSDWYDIRYPRKYSFMINIEPHWF